MTAALTGLRGRVLLALVATSLATLVAASLVVVPPLERRLETDRLDELRGLARTIRPALRAIPVEDRRRGAPELRHLVDRLQRRAGGRIAVYDSRHTELADSSADVLPPGLRLQQRALRRGDVITGERGGVAYAITAAGAGSTRMTLVIAKRLDDSRAAAAVVRAALPLALGAALVVALALAVALSRSLLRRLERLRGDAEALGTEGLAHRIEVSGGDEVSVVARALEEMRTRLVEEQTARQDFLSTASHELRTPLASLQATLELLEEELLRGRVEPHEAAARAETALRQTHRLVALATDLLDLSRVDGHAPLAPEPIELGDLAETVAREFGPRLDAAGRELRIEGGPALATADPAAAARILRVLLDNAANYGAGTVTVGIARDGDEVVVTVSDEGEGLADDERERVFRRFARGRAAAGAPSGSGLGLAIARGLADAMGGTLAPAPPGAGARFVLTLRPAADHTLSMVS